MIDVIRFCDVIDNCEDCPRYGDDCDGSTERLYTHKEAWGMTDLRKKDCSECKHFDEFHTSRACHDCKPWKSSTDIISRQDAIALVIKAIHGTDNKEIQEYLMDGLRKQMWALPSAEAEPTVIRSRTLLPTKDFKEWAKRIRETNPNAVVIPCDAEVVSAEAVQGWIPCSERLPSESGEYLATIPLDADETYTEVLTFHKGRFYEDDDEWGATYHDDVLAWMTLPTPYKGGDDK